MVEKVTVMWSRVVVSIVLAYPIGKATNSTLPQYFLRPAMRGGYLSVFFASSTSQPKSLQKPISTRMPVDCFLLKEVELGEGEFGGPLAFIRSGAVPYIAGGQ